MIDQILIAVEKLKKGEVVAVPTETVYGLAAVISDASAINRIFTTKQRPFFDPLIVHVSGVEQAKEFAKTWSESIEILAREFWPGPLTFVVPKKNVSDLITSGLETVGLRCPAHKMTLDIIKKIGEPLAAPSANRFGKTSPTCAKDVGEEFNNEVFVVDGGACIVGIESTIISVIESMNQVEISLLRSGVVTPKQISAILGNYNKKVVFVKSNNKIIAPGQVEHHYMPRIPILLVSRRILDKMNCLDAPRKLIPELVYNRPSELKLNSSPAIAARELYSQMRKCSLPPADIIVCVRESFQTGEEWDSIVDRINRASSYKFL